MSKKRPRTQETQTETEKEDKEQREKAPDLSPDQKYALERVVAKKNVFITGAAGVGKSFLIETIVRVLKEAGRRVIVTATTGIAAVNVGGNTLHSFAGLGIGKDPDSVLHRKARQSYHKQRWKSLDVLIVDEISMLSPSYFETLVKFVRMTTDWHHAFGPIQLILCGDFFQLPPVPDDKKVDASARFAFESPYWKQCIDETIELTTVFRQQDPAFIHILHQIRKGQVTDEAQALLQQRVDATVANPTRLYSRRQQVDSMNAERLADLSTSLVVLQGKASYISAAAKKRKKRKSKKEEASFFDDDEEEEDNKKHALKLDVFVEQTRAPMNLTLKKGAHVLLLVNLDVKHGLVNGCCGVVKDFVQEGAGTSSPHFPLIRFDHCEVIIRQWTWKQKDGDRGDMQFTQIPLALAYALTIHKSQGMSLTRAELLLDRSIFEYGQFYVALSRIRSLDGLRLLDFDASVAKAHPRVLAYYESLSH